MVLGIFENSGEILVGGLIVICVSAALYSRKRWIESRRNSPASGKPEFSASFVCDECRKEVAKVYLAPGRRVLWLPLSKRQLCWSCVQRLHPKDCPVDQEAIDRRVSEMKWFRFAELPGFKEWSAQYQNLDEVIPDSDNYRILVHPDEFDQSFDSKFEGIFQGWLNEWEERGGPHRTLNDYKRI